MKKAFLLLLTFVLPGCATIISGTEDQLTINSTPDKMPYIVKNKNGTVVHRGTTPDIISLKRKYGYFQGEKYSVAPDEEGSHPIPIDTSLNPWYFGNLIFGGLIGGVFVDPITGGMWELQDNVDIKK